jgi:hypothetical protein
MRMRPTQSDRLPSGEVELWPSPIGDGEWVDSDGVRWRLRGPGHHVPVKRVKKLLLSPDVRVLLFYGPDAPTEIESADREACWHRVRPYLSEPLIRARGDHTDFFAAEFKDDRGRCLLVIEESC